MRDIGPGITSSLGLGRACLVALALLLLSPLGIDAADDSRADVVAPETRDRAARDGRARVIVEVRLPGGDHVAEGRLSRAAADVQRRDVADARRALLTRLSGRQHRVIHAFETVPFVVLEVGPDAVAELEASRFWVKRAVPDRLHEPALQQSAPLVGASQTWSAGYDGAGKVVAILDTGVQSSHPFLAGKVVEEACYSSTVTGRSVTLCPNGAEEQLGAGAAAPCSLGQCWHGTHVAGIAAGNGATFSGIARAARIMAVQVFSRFTLSGDCGGSAPCVRAWTSDIIAGLDRVYQRRNAHSIAAANLSLGGGVFTSPCDTDPTKAIIDTLRSVGIATTVAAGNNGAANGLSSPACISTAVSVSSTTKQDAVSSFSNVAPFLSLFAPGDGIWSSYLGSGFTSGTGTSMAAPHVAGAWAVMKDGVPGAGVSTILGALQATGVPITETSEAGTVVRPRIRIDQALAALLPAVTSVTPGQGTQGATVPVTINGARFAVGATVDVGAGIAVTGVTRVSASQLTATLTVGPGATPGPRDVTVMNPDGGVGALAGGFTVASASAATLTVVYNGKVQDRVGAGNTLLGPDGALDGTLTATLSASGGRTVTGLRLDSAGSTAGTWDTASGTGFWALGAARSLGEGTLNAAGSMAVSFAVANGGSFVVFAADYAGLMFQPGRQLTLRATFSDGSTATAVTTVGSVTPPAAATLTVVYNGKVQDRVGAGNTALGPDGALDGTLTATLSASGGRTVTGLRLDSAGSTAGTWDTASGTGFWALGAARSLGEGTLNAAGSMAVSFAVANGGSFVVFAADYANMMFQPGRQLTLRATFSDGSTATAVTTVGSVTPPAAATLTVVYNGKVQDRVGAGNTLLGPDGALDGTLTATLSASGGRTVTGLRLDSDASTPGTWDTASGTAFWALGAARSLGEGTLNTAGSMAVSFAVANGGSFVVFAADYANMMFQPGRRLTLRATFSDGTTATAVTIVQ